MIKNKCLTCGDEVLVKNYHAKKGWGKYCSKTCQFKDQISGKWLKCDNCGKEVYRTPKDFKRSKSGKFFCSVIGRIINQKIYNGYAGIAIA